MTAEERHIFQGRVVVVSPHLDDAVMSLGSTVACAAQSGAQVELLTVFADHPASAEPASPWDLTCGFVTEGQAASVRRAEDRRACDIIGAAPRWLDFGSECYSRRGTLDDIRQAVHAVTADADVVLVPGFPLAHSDHRCVAEILLGRGLSCRHVGLYVEQPYAYSLRRNPAAMPSPGRVPSLDPRSLAWTHLGAERSHRRAKARAVRSYRSQLRRLGLKRFGLHRLLRHEAAQGGEAIAWLS
jgi:LmbE family N-acetylglucosaminyl deacetylase